MANASAWQVSLAYQGPVPRGLYSIFPAIVIVLDVCVDLSCEKQ